MKNSGIEWVGIVPKHWNINFLNQLFSQLKNKNNDMQETNLLSLSYGKIKRKDINSNEGLLPDNFSGYNIVDKYDIVLRLTDLQNDHTSLRVGLVNEKGIITSAYVTLRCKDDINTEYFYLYLHSFDLSKGFYGMGSGVRQGLTYDGIKYLKLIVPPVEEQRQIINYLNKKCAEIDDVITQTTRSIEEYKKYKQSIITEAVTKGLNFDVDSNWTLKKMGSIATYKKGPFGSAIKVSMFVPKSEKTIKVYEQKNAIKKDVSLGSAYINMETYNNLQSFEVFTGDIIVSCAGTIGECFIMPENMEKGIINQALMKVTLNNDMSTEFFLYLFDVMLKELSAEYSNGSAIKNIPPFEILKKHKIKVPSTKRQSEIVAYLDKKCFDIDNLITQKVLLLTELEAYKKSLIYECITGKREVN